MVPVAWISQSTTTGVLLCPPSHLYPTRCSWLPRGPISLKNINTSARGPTSEADPDTPPSLCQPRQHTKPFLFLLWPKSPMKPQLGRLPHIPQGHPGGAGTSLTTKASKSAITWLHFGPGRWGLFLCPSVSMNHTCQNRPRDWRPHIWAREENGQEAFLNEQVPFSYPLFHRFLKTTGKVGVLSPAAQEEADLGRLVD